MLEVAALILAALFRSAWPQPLAPRPDVRGHRKLYRHVITQVIGGLWLGLAGWVAGAVLQAWVPIGQMLVVGITLSVASAGVMQIERLPSGFRGFMRPAADFLNVAMLGVLSVIPVWPALVIAAAFGFAAAGFLIDRIIGAVDGIGAKWAVRRIGAQSAGGSIDAQSSVGRVGSLLSHPRLSGVLLVIPAVLVLVLVLQVRQPGNFGSRLLEEDPLFPLRVALVIPSAGERVPMPEHTAAWFRETPGGEPRGTAIVLHGNHRLGSRQPSGMVLQGALIRARYDVLSVDHPGFGASATPPTSANWRAWDPTHGVLEALRKLHAEAERETIVVGHSMGVDVALKLAADGAALRAMYLWGGSLDRPYGANWVSGFHRERNIPCCLPHASLDRIREEFYGGGDRFAAALPDNHAPVHFVRFGIEHADVTRDREPLYAAITEPKAQCDFDSVSHYFNTLAIRGFVLVDTLTIRRAAKIFASGC